MVSEQKASPLAHADRSEGPGVPYDKLKPGPGRRPAEVADHQRERIHRAMIELVAERGYSSVTVRELAKRATVSTRSFYCHYSGKEECFLHTHDLVVRRVLRNLAPSKKGPYPWEEHVRNVVRALIEEWGRDPRAAQLMLVDAYTAGPLAVKQTRRAIRTIEEAIIESFNFAVEEPKVSGLLVAGIVAGSAGLVRARLLAGASGEVAGLTDELADWATACCRSPLIHLGGSDWIELERQRYLSGSPPSVRSAREEGVSAPTDAVALLLMATAKLVAESGCESLTLGKVAAAAGVPQRSFYANFSSMEECFVAAVELHANEAIADARQAAEDALTPAARVGQVAASLCARIAADSAFARLCFDEIAIAGLSAARCREHLIAEVSDLIESEITGRDNGRLSTEASVAALWGVLEREVNAGRASKVPCVLPVLTYLLAPTVDASTVIDIRREERSINPGRTTNQHVKT